MFCKKCGRKLESGDAYCTACGTACATYPDSHAELENLGHATLYASPDVMGGSVFDEDDYTSRILVDPPPIDPPAVPRTALDERVRSVAEEVEHARRSAGALCDEVAMSHLFSRDFREDIIAAIEECERDLGVCEVLLRGIAEMAKSVRMEQGRQRLGPGGKALGVGDVLGGRFRIGRLLRRSGLGGVYEVSDMQDGGARCIAKVADSGQASGPVLNEARILAKLDHPRIPRLIASSVDGDPVWLVEQRFEGSTLSNRTVILCDDSDDSDYCLRVDRDLCLWMIEVCDALAYLHRQDPPVLHHDIKPDNIFIGQDGEARLIDFGIAMECDPFGGTDALTAGTRGFAAPETRQEPYRSDQRSDIYSLGAAMWHEKANWVLRKRLDELPLPDLRIEQGEDGPDRLQISEALANVIMKCVRTDPDDRYQTADELADALRDAAIGLIRAESGFDARDGASPTPGELRKVFEETKREVECGEYRLVVGKAKFACGYEEHRRAEHIPADAVGRLVAEPDLGIPVSRGSRRRIIVHNCDSLEGLRFAELFSTSPDAGGRPPLVLNFANPHEPGGGVERGAMAQEEELCRRTTLYASLSSDGARGFYEDNLASDTAVFTDGMVLSPCVEVFKRPNYEGIWRPQCIAVLTCPAPYAPALGDMPPGELAAICKRRIKGMLMVAAANGYRALVLGAWGCGAFGNDPDMMARMFREAIDEVCDGPGGGAGRGAGAGSMFDCIVFAVLDRTEDKRNYRAFETAFSVPAVLGDPESRHVLEATSR